MQELKGRILVKGKKHTPHLGELVKNSSCTSFSSSSEDELASSIKSTPMKDPAKVSSRKACYWVVEAVNTNALVNWPIFFALPFPGPFETVPRAIRPGGLLQECPLPWVWKCVWKTAKWNVFFLWKRCPQAHQRVWYNSGDNCILTSDREIQKVCQHRVFCAAGSAGSTEIIISPQRIMACGFLSFYLQGSFL